MLTYAMLQATSQLLLHIYIMCVCVCVRVCIIYIYTACTLLVLLRLSSYLPARVFPHALPRRQLGKQTAAVGGPEARLLANLCSLCLLTAC